MKAAFEIAAQGLIGAIGGSLVQCFNVVALSGSFEPAYVAVPAVALAAYTYLNKRYSKPKP